MWFWFQHSLHSELVCDNIENGRNDGEEEGAIDWETVDRSVTLLKFLYAAALRCIKVYNLCEKNSSDEGDFPHFFTSTGLPLYLEGLHVPLPSREHVFKYVHSPQFSQSFRPDIPRTVIVRPTMLKHTCRGTLAATRCLQDF